MLGTLRFAQPTDPPGHAARFDPGRAFRYAAPSVVPPSLRRFALGRALPASGWAHGKAAGYPTELGDKASRKPI